MEKTRIFIGTHINTDILYSDNHIENPEQFFGSSIKLVEKENIHLTWKFIGDIEVDKLEKVKHLIKQSITPHDIEITFLKYAIWPNKKNPRQLVIEGKDSNKSGTCLYKALNNNLYQSLGIKKEKRPFNPHITIGRFRKNERVLLYDDLEFKEVCIEFKVLSLFQSILTPKGSIYELIEEFEL